MENFKKVKFNITGVSNLGTWTISRYLKLNINEELDMFEIACLIDLKFSTSSPYHKWEKIEYDYPVESLITKDWFFDESYNRIKELADLIKQK